MDSKANKKESELTKKLIYYMLILTAVLSCFISCNANGVDEVVSSGSQNVQIKFIGGAKSVSVGTEYPSADSLYWAYTAVKKNGGGTTGQKTSPVALTGANVPGFNQTLTFSVGSWYFDLYGFGTEAERAGAISAGGDLTRKCTYHACKNQTLVFSRKVTGISLEAAPYSDAGYLDGQIRLTTTSVNGNFVAYKIGTADSWFTTASDAQIIHSGFNTITLRLYESGKVAGSEDYLNETVLSNITIYSGLKTTLGGTWDDPTTAAKFDIQTNAPDYWTVTFDPNYDDAGIIYRIVESGTATTAPELSRSGYTLSKWTANKDGSGEVFSPSENVTSNKTYYAQWKNEQ